MTRQGKTAILCFGLTMALMGGGVAEAKEKVAATVVAPIPTQILAAKKVFIANGGGDVSHTEEVFYSGGSDRTYNEFYAGMKSWGRYELVGAPADADLIFEIQLTVFQLQRNRILEDDSLALDSQLRIVIRDPKSGQTLWGLTSHVQEAVLLSNRDKNYEVAMGAILAEVRRIGAPISATQATPNVRGD